MITFAAITPLTITHDGDSNAHFPPLLAMLELLQRATLWPFLHQRRLWPPALFLHPRDISKHGQVGLKTALSSQAALRAALSDTPILSSLDTQIYCGISCITASCNQNAVDLR